MSSQYSLCQLLIDIKTTYLVCYSKKVDGLICLHLTLFILETLMRLIQILIATAVFSALLSPLASHADEKI